jgi:predicted amino acid-binding ACT domain protein
MVVTIQGCDRVGIVTILGLRLGLGLGYKEAD